METAQTPDDTGETNICRVNGISDSCHQGDKQRHQHGDKHEQRCNGGSHIDSRTGHSLSGSKPTEHTSTPADKGVSGKVDTVKEGVRDSLSTDNADFVKDGETNARDVPSCNRDSANDNGPSERSAASGRQTPTSVSPVPGDADVKHSKDDTSLAQHSPPDRSADVTAAAARQDSPSLSSQDEEEGGTAETEERDSPQTDVTEVSDGDELEVGVHEGLTYCVYSSELRMPDIMRLMTADLSEPYSIYTYRYFIHNWPRLCFLAKDGEKCVGAVVCKLDEHKKVVRRGYIAMLAVDDSYRRRGIGSQLVTRAIRAMVMDDCDEVALETEITNKAALRLYERLGFVRDKRLFRYYLNGVDALRLKLWLR